MNTSLSLPVHEATQAGEARRMATAWAKERGCGEDLTARLALVVTELGRNLATHTSGGRLLLRRLSGARNDGVEVLSLDNGPGMANLNECLRDGFSTAGTPGTGLGAVQRASQVFSVYTQPGNGTALLSEVWSSPSESPRTRSWVEGGASVPYPRELVCGDAWAEMTPRPGVVRCVLADGLGHGPYAAEAAVKATEVFLKYPHAGLAVLLDDMHGALRSTRGAAVAVAEVDFGRGEVSYAGIGNIAASIVCHETSTNLVSMNGTVGGQHRGVRVFQYPWRRDATLILSSDGLRSRWQFEQYPGLLGRHPALIAGVLFRDHARESDDATVVVLRAQS